MTKEDLQEFRMQLINDLKIIISQSRQPANENTEGYKTSHVQKILGYSVNKLVALRIPGKLRMKKIGGTNYYNKEYMKRLLEEGY